MTEKPRRARFRQQPRLETPLGHLIAGDIDQAEYRRRMSLKVHREQPDPDPRYVAEDDDQRVPRHDAYEPVSSKRVWRLLFLILFAILLALYATSRSAAVIPAPEPIGEPDQRQTAASPDVGRAGGAAIPRAEAPVPSPSGGVSSIVQAEATWCAPTPTHCQGWGGKVAYGAVYGFRWGDQPYWARVEYRGKVSDVLIVSHCACQGSHGYIDVSPFAFEKLAPRGVGRIDVTVTWPVEAPDQSGDDPSPHPDDDRMRQEDGGPTLPPTNR